MTQGTVFANEVKQSSHYCNFDGGLGFGTGSVGDADGGFGSASAFVLESGT